ncbi:hypothetical protein ECANGB1_1391 [Enterospora canceri]|uniref:Uncharacterized protein n=1 Tax=Enterospora canceri TaxID=1081671 RepID=A0A1Y1S632_9MICR|nr:hypothetical protein ECANGB1_1391 [Enterospora canceri]
MKIAVFLLQLVVAVEYEATDLNKISADNRSMLIKESNDIFNNSLFNTNGSFIVTSMNAKPKKKPQKKPKKDDEE